MAPKRWCFFHCKQELEMKECTIDLNLKIYCNKNTESHHETKQKADRDK
jgi:hypothetical protein